MRYLWIAVAVVLVSIGVLVFGGGEKGSLKIGYVDIAKAMENYSKMKELNEEYKKDVAFYQEKLRKIEKEIEQLQEKGAPQEEIAKKQNELLQKKNLYEGLIQQEYQPRIQRIMNEVVQKAKEFAQISGYDVLLTNQGAVYVSEKYDVTDAFIEYLNTSGGK